MKLFYNLCGMGVAGLLGYSLEPNLRLQLTGMAPGKAEMVQNDKVVLEMGGAGGERIDLESLKPEQLPAKILVNTDVELKDAATGVTMKIPKGFQVKLLRIEGGNAVVGTDTGPYEGKIPVTDTDLLKQLSENPPTTAPKADPPPAPEPAPAPVTPTGESAEPPTMTEPPPVPAPAPEPAADPAPKMEPTPLPEPSPVVKETEPAPAGAAAGGPAVQIMQDSVKSGQIKEFKFEQVTEWKQGEPETVEGESFQTGTALYKAVTFLGEKSIEAKAYIKDGKVKRWIWPRSGMEIK